MGGDENCWHIRVLHSTGAPAGGEAVRAENSRRAGG